MIKLPIQIVKRLTLLLSVLLLPLIARATSTINNTNAFSYGEYIGWLNWHGSGVGQSPGPYSVVIGEYICQGWIYGANVGWISMCRKDPTTFADVEPANHIQYSNTQISPPSGPIDYGVNYTINPTTPGVAFLRGLAYGANIGWINFDDPGFAFPAGILKPQINLITGKLSGYAYSANCGYIDLSAFDQGAVERYVQTDHIAMGVDTDDDGIADAFEYQYFSNLTSANGLTNTDSDGDGMSDVSEYLEGTNPLLADDRFRITLYNRVPNPPISQDSQITWKSTTARLYKIETTPNLLDPLSWVDSGLGTFAPDASTFTMRTLTLPTATQRFFRVKAIRPLP